MISWNGMHCIICFLLSYFLAHLWVCVEQTPVIQALGVTLQDPDIYPQPDKWVFVLAHWSMGKAQIPLRWLSPKLPHGESRGHKRWQIMKPCSFGESRRHKSRKSWTQTISTCQDVCDKVWDKFTTKSRTCRRHKSWKSVTWFVPQT